MKEPTVGWFDFIFWFQVRHEIVFRRQPSQVVIAITVVLCCGCVTWWWWLAVGWR
jgi:hypothetical protein